MHKNIKRQMYIESYQIIDNRNINNLSEHYLVDKNDHMQFEQPNYQNQKRRKPFNVGVNTRKENKTTYFHFSHCSKDEA